MAPEAASFLPFSSQIKKLYGKACRAVCRRYHLTQTEFDILDFLGERTEQDTAGEISRRRLIRKANVSTSVDRLIRKGYLFRQVDLRDRRIIHLRLTPTVYPMIEEIREAKREFFSRLLAVLNEEEIAALDRLCRKLLSAVSPYGKDLKGGAL